MTCEQMWHTSSQFLIDAIDGPSFSRVPSPAPSAGNIKVTSQGHHSHLNYSVNLSMTRNRNVVGVRNETIVVTATGIV